MFAGEVILPDRQMTACCIEEGEMKKVLQKIFCWDSPERGAFQSLVVMLLGCWLLGSLGIFCPVGKWQFDCCYNIQSGFPGLVRLGCFAVAGLFLVVSFFWQTGRALRRFSRKNADSACKKWLWISCLCWIFTLAAVAYCIWLLVSNWRFDGILFVVGSKGAPLPLLLGACGLLLLGSVCATGKFYSSLGGFGCKELFTVPVLIFTAVTIAAYAGMVSASLILQKKCETEKAALEKHFGRPFSAEALAQVLTGNRRVDEAFWKRVAKLLQKDKSREAFYCFDEFTPEELASWRSRFSASKEFAELDQMISAPLPVPPYKVEKYQLFSCLLPELSHIRDLARLQVWNCRFAAERGDGAAAAAALKRMDNLTAFLADRTVLISALVKVALESYKLRAVETLLAAKVLSEAELLELKQQCRASRKNLGTVEKNILWCEALCGVDYVEGTFNAEKTWNGIKNVPMKKISFFLPQYWLWYEGCRLNLLRLYSKTEKCHDIKEVKTDTVFNHLACHLVPSFRTAGDRFLRHDLELQAIEFFIDQELFRLKNGKFPENQVLPVDPFSKKRMKYICGKVTLKKGFFGKEAQKITVSGRQLTSETAGGLNVTVTIPD